MKKLKLSRFQKVIFYFFIVLLFLGGLYKYMIIEGGDVSTPRLKGFAIESGLTPAIISALILYFLMWIYNRFIRHRIKIKNKVLIKTWSVIRIIIICLIVLWFIITLIGFIIGYK